MPTDARTDDLAPLLAPLRDPERADLLADADLELGADDHLIHHLGKAVPSDSLIPFGKHGSGSLLALWRPDPHTPLARCPVAWFDSEGDPIDLIAPDFAAFLELLPYGLGQIYDLLRKAQRMRAPHLPGRKPDPFEVSVTDLRDGLRMISDDLGEWRELGLPPAADPLAIVERALALPFAAWWSALPGSA